MGRWRAKCDAEQSNAAEGETNANLLLLSDHPSQSPQTSCKTSFTNGTSSESTSAFQACPASVSVERAVEDVEQDIDLLFKSLSLSEGQRRIWQCLSENVSGNIPLPGEAKSKAPTAEMLAALQSARAARENFIATLSATQQSEVKELLELEKKLRKLQIKAEAKQFKRGCSTNMAPNEDDAVNANTADMQKEVIRRAFECWQKDRQIESGTNKVDSTEWKRLRALGGTDPTLRMYLERAGWNSAWPLPKPEGRLLRREGQAAALKRYAKK